MQSNQVIILREHSDSKLWLTLDWKLVTVKSILCSCAKNMRFVVSGALSGDNRIAEFVKTHGDGVKDVALLVDDVDKAYSEAVKRGAVAIAPPVELTDENGTLKKQLLVRMVIQFTRL